ncbi:uncharacterized protein MELLADRAFT_58819 [Melampsora larici-populina 98AG31]|uniref:Uncharacterized protein n=1 Tax=Melampsora larici-populina (strain 98AG31 / pathotype 3-4-7) TaxID=747676 RepID=F4R2X8_MELLP|nr:uncharacterized protein MELLADRAFT_58819 [Melampsora larici-populina 98AG31]EGG12908.1 hypothetical protein MELLADRAFT_58819 [Melampsora larici-populina 98AG31]
MYQSNQQQQQQQQQGYHHQLNRTSISSNHSIKMNHHHQQQQHHHQHFQPQPQPHFQIPIHHQQHQTPLHQFQFQQLHHQPVPPSPSHNFQFNRNHHSNSLHPNHHHHLNHHHPNHLNHLNNPFLINPPSIPLQSPLPPTFSAYLQQHKHQQLLSSPSLNQPRSPTSSNHSSYQTQPSSSLHHPNHNHQSPFNQYSKPEPKRPSTPPSNLLNLTTPPSNLSNLTTPQLITPLSIISNGTRKKLKIRLPLEFTPDHELSLDESRIRSKWKRLPISTNPAQLGPSNPSDLLLLHSTSKDEWPERLGNRLPDSIDVYLPGKEVWDDYRAEILDEKLNELGYHSIQQDENLVHLDLRLRLEAYLSDHPESTLQIPTIPGIYPFALPSSPLSPISKPLMSFTAPMMAPRGHSSTMSIALPGGTPNQYLASNRSPTFGPPSTPGEPIGPLPPPPPPGLKPTAPVFKPTGTLLPTAPEFQPTWAPAPVPVPISIRPRGSVSPHRMLLSPTLMIVGEEEEEVEAETEDPKRPSEDQEEIVTDSEADSIQAQVLTDSEVEDDQEEEEEEGESMMRNEVTEDYYSGPDSVEEEVMNEHNHLMRSSISSQALRRISFKPIISDPRTVVMKARSSAGEEEDDIPLAKLKDRRFSTQLHQLDHSSQSSSLPTGIQISQDQRSEYTNPSDEDELEVPRADRKPSSASLPNHRTTRSHTFGINSFSVSGRSSMTGGDGIPHNWINGVEDEDDIISNPSDEDHELIQNEDHHLYTTNLEATRSTITADEEVSKPNLNAFAAEFTPNFNFSSMIPHIGSLSKQVIEDDEHQLIGSPGRGIKRQKTQQEVWIEEEGPLIPSFSEHLPPLRQSVSLPPPFSLPELPERLGGSSSGLTSDLIREDPNYEHQKTLPHDLGSIMIPNSPLIRDRLLPIMRDQPMTPKVPRLRPSSSFDDDSTSSIDHHSRSSSPSPSRVLNQARSFELIPTQNLSSKDSMISLNQLKQQQIEWNQIGNQPNVKAQIGNEEIVKISSSASKKRGEIPKFLSHDLDHENCRPAPPSQITRIEKINVGPKIVVEEKSGGIEEMGFLDPAGVSTIRISNRVHLDDDDDAEEDEEEEDEEMQSGSSEDDEVEEANLSMRSSTTYLNKLLNKKFKELRQDLSGLHTLKVDFDSLKRDALLEEMHKRMEMVIEESQRKEKGKDLEIILRSIRDLKNGEEEIEMMMKKLSEAVKPQIYQLIDLTSDKSETAGLIVQELKPSLEDLMKRLIGELRVENEKIKEKRIDEDEHRESLKVGEEMIELITQLDLKSLNFYQDISQQIGSTMNEISELIKSEIRREVLESKENEIQELRNVKNELELGLLKARADHGRVRSERAVEKEKIMEEKSKVERELEELRKKKRMDELEIERFRKEKEEMEGSRRVQGVEKESVERERDRLKELVARLESRCEGFEVKGREWETKRILQTEEIAELKVKNRMIESNNKSNERGLELSQNGYERLQEVRNLDLIRYQTKEDELRKEIRNQEIEFGKRYQEMGREIREAVEGKALVEGELRSLEGRIHKLDEQISGLREMSAAKQQSLATVNQRLYESERKSKEVESLRNEMTRMKGENERMKAIESDYRRMEEEKARIEEENVELVREIGEVKEGLEKMYESVGKELSEVYVKNQSLEEELGVVRLEKEGLEKEVLERERLEKERLEKEKLERERLEKERLEERLEKEKLEKERLEKEKEKENLIRFEGDSSYRNLQETPKKFYPTPPLQSYDFVKSNVPLSNSIHAPKNQPKQKQLQQHYQQAYQPRGSEDLYDWFLIFEWYSID